MAGQGEIAGGREGAISTTENGDMHENPGKPIGKGVKSCTSRRR
jgi:hypothetical protein